MASCCGNRVRHLLAFTGRERGCELAMLGVRLGVAHSALSRTLGVQLLGSVLRREV
jgi:hypothetical protein